MKYKTVGKLYNLEIETKYSGRLLFHNIKISNNPNKFIENFGNDDFIALVGMIQFHDYVNSTHLYSIGVHDNISSGSTAERFLMVESLFYQLFIQCLWIVKDNSVNFEESFIEVTDNSEKKVSMYSRSFHFTDASGKVNKVLFNLKELEEAETYFVYFKELVDKNVKNRADESIIHSQKFDEFFECYGLNSNRIDRFFYILHNARTENYLPARIAMYTIALEALVSTDEREVTHQTAERTALLMFNNDISKYKIYQFVKEMYRIRSSYIHGNKLSKSFKKKGLEYLIDSSIEFDDLLRRLIRKILSDDSLQSLYIQDNTEELNNFFIRKILE